MNPEHEHLQQFAENRRRMNEKILASGHIGIQRFFNLDTRAYEPGVLDAKTKELMGLVASMVLRCNDCIDYHIVQSAQAGATDAELHETFNIALIVGGSIVIPHLRHAFQTLEQVRQSPPEL